MIKTGSQFSFEIPDGWGEASDGGRLVFHAPESEPFQELIVQGSQVTGRGPEAERQKAVAEVFENAVRALGDIVASEPFAVIRPLGPDGTLVEPQAWSVEARSSGDGTLFCGAVFRGPSGVLFVTAESAAEARPVFRQFADSVRLVTHAAPEPRPWWKLW
jgi:hypothetical protein